MFRTMSKLSVLPGIVHEIGGNAPFRSDAAIMLYVAASHQRALDAGERVEGQGASTYFRGGQCSTAAHIAIS